MANESEEAKANLWININIAINEAKSCALETKSNSKDRKR